MDDGDAMRQNSLSLPVVSQPLESQPADSQYELLVDKLQALDVGEVRTGIHDRTLYATDASLYQVLPLAVVIPSSIEQLRRLINYCAPEKLPVMGRGGGTSLAGQCTNRAVVIDFSPHWRGMRDLDVSRRTCIVEPGISIEQINHQLAARRVPLFFAPDPASGAQAAVGGCIGNNAAGARSLRYGRMSENIDGIKVLLSTGEECWLEKGAGQNNPAAMRLAQQTAAVVRSGAALIHERFPKLIRRNAGYSLDLVLRQLDAGVRLETLDLSGLICGSEGTLALVTAARLLLRPRPAARALALIGCDSLEDAIGLVQGILTVNPSAVELLDDVVIGAAAGNSQCRAYLDILPRLGDQMPAAVLYVEFEIDPSSIPVSAAIAERFAALKRMIGDRPCGLFESPEAMNQAWQLRKSAEALLHAVSASRKPITFVEDNAVPVERLPEFVAEFKKIVSGHATSAAFYAHASVGVLHVRPLLDLHQPGDLKAMREISIQVARLARDCGGVVSGEHGDGRVRGPLLEEFYGPELMQMFRKIKNIFDPAGILNPGMITSPGPVENIVRNLRIAAEAPASPNIKNCRTYFDYSDQEHFRGAVEMCNGAGFCRKTSVGTMCPSFRATLDERHSPRGRANALRWAILGADEPKWKDADTLQTLDLCLSCKACKTECPSNVDIARLKAEYLAQRYQSTGVPLAARAFGQIRTLNYFGSRMPGLANRLQLFAPFRAMANRFLGLAPQRSLPQFSRSLYTFSRRAPAQNLPADAPRVVLFADCFTGFTESRVGLAALSVLNAFGYRTELPHTGCCARALISTGMMAKARGQIRSTLDCLRNSLIDPALRAVLVLEPSCLSAMLDDYKSIRDLDRGELLNLLARKAMLVEDFLDRFWDVHPVRPQMASSPGSVLFHGHCHQKALWGDGTSTRLLSRIAGPRLSALPTGCCGMAGAFGYTAGHYEVSMKIFQAPEFDPLRQAGSDSAILAPGSSCRQQIHHALNRRALHPIEWMDSLIT